MDSPGKKIGVVIPCFRVRQQIHDVLRAIGPEVTAIYVVDDGCPESTGREVQANVEDKRVRVLFHERNLGVGAAVATGYRQALEEGMEVVVKIDGDGQMDPRLLPQIVKPVVDGRADYAKGNRFFELEALSEMPRARLFGNAVLSFLTKVSSGYWGVMDPTNGYTAIHAGVLRSIRLDKVDRGYFFESDLLFRLNIIGAVVDDVPMRPMYGNENSNVSIAKACFQFPAKHAVRFLKRVFYRYFLRDFNICSLEILFGLGFLAFGCLFGLYHWYRSVTDGVAATTGTVMIAALPVMLGFQLVLAAIIYDVMNVPRRPLQHRLAGAGGGDRR